MPRCETPYKGHFRRVRLLTDRLVFARWLMVALTVLLVSVGPDRAVAQSDAELIHNAYHEMTEHDAMLRHIRAALKPGGRLLVVEPLHDASRGLSRDQQVAKHDIEPDIVNGELRAAGFDVVERDDNFIKFTGVPGGFWMILARSK